MFNKILKEESEFVTKGSGWSLNITDELQLRVNIINPLRGSSFIPLPKHIALKKAVINIQNTNSKCFKYSIVSKYDKRVNSFKYSKSHFNYLEKKSKLNFNCIDFPTPVKQIKIFERVNNVPVNVFGLNEEGFVYPVYINDNEKENNFDLFFYDNGTTSHYCYVKKFSRLGRSQKTKYHSKLIICKRCFTVFGNKPCKIKLWGKAGLKQHKLICKQHKLGRPIMFEKDDAHFIQFQNYNRMERIPIFIYADFECLLKRMRQSQN